MYATSESFADRVIRTYLYGHDFLPADLTSESIIRSIPSNQDGELRITVTGAKTPKLSRSS
jgi:hypothetical protein